MPGVRRDAGGELSMTGNSLTLVASRVAAMGLGFLFWLLAARLFDASEVGLAAAVVAAMMLCTNLALMGLGSAVITRLPHHRDAPAALISCALTLVTAAAALAAFGFLCVASALGELGVLVREPLYGLLFVVCTVFGTLGLLLEQASTAMRRGDQALVRGVAFGASTLASLVAIVLVSDAGGSELLFVPWVIAGAVMLALGVRHLAQALDGFRLRFRAPRSLARELVRSGLPNHVLTLADRVPGLLLPLVVAEVVSPADNATWYAIWMMATAVYIVPMQVGMAMFAEVATDAGSMRRSLRGGLLSSLAVGVPAALVVAVAAGLLLSLMGAGYADSGAGPLRTLVIAVIPVTIIQLYYAACRGAGRLREAIAAGWVSGGVAVVLCAVAGASGGLGAMALAWVLTQVAASIWAGTRLLALIGAPRRATAAGRALTVPDGAP